MSAEKTDTLKQELLARLKLSKIRAERMTGMINDALKNLNELQDEVTIIGESLVDWIDETQGEKK